jgi:DNA-binding NtrC family response regulator
MTTPSERLPGVLIIDPDPVARTELAAGLEELGWWVCEADGSADALEAYEADGDRIDVALVDLQLPGLLGSGVLADLGRVAPALPRCVTAPPVNPHAAVAFRRACDAPVFPRPIRPEDLSAALHEMILPACA